MKHSPIKSSKAQRETSTKSEGVSFPPPEYGIEFVDRYSTKEDIFQKPEKCGCQGKKKRLGSRRCACDEPQKRPPKGSLSMLDEESGARELSPIVDQDVRHPHDGSATIVCDGNGGYRVDLGDWAGAPCGIEGCVTKHEESHITDWLKRWPNGCKNSDGSNKPDGGAIPLGGPDYAAFLKKSECDAYTVEEGCISPLVGSASGACKTTLKDHLLDTRNQKASYCSWEQGIEILQENNADQSEEKYVRVASDFAQSQGYNLKSYSISSKQRVNGMFVIIFQGKSGLPGDHFSVQVDRITAKVVKLVPGR